MENEYPYLYRYLKACADYHRLSLAQVLTTIGPRYCSELSGLSRSSISRLWNHGILTQGMKVYVSIISAAFKANPRAVEVIIELEDRLRKKEEG